MRKCQSKNPSACKVHGTGGHAAQLEAQSLQAIQEGRTEDYFQIREEIDALRDEVTPDQKTSFFGRMFGRTPTPQPAAVRRPANKTVIPHDHMPSSAVRAEAEQPKPEGTLVDCGKCDGCNPPPSDMTHFGRWAGNECSNPTFIPKS